MPVEQKTARDEALAELGNAWREMSIANRRLRGRDAMKEGTLSVPQYTLVSKLLDVEECASGELADHAGLTAATATHMLEQLARDGILERERSAADRRVVVTRLTPGGREIVQGKHDELVNAWTAMVEDLDEDALLQSADVLRRMASYLDRL